MIQEMNAEKNELPEFDFEAVFEVEDYLYFYNEVLSDEVTEKQVSFLVRQLGLEAPAHILDLACGFGRHANRLAALGHHVTGIDLTPGFLNLARKVAEARGLQVEYQQGDMRYIEFDQVFDHILLLFTAFGYFSDNENAQVLQRIGKALRKGGGFVFDVPNRDVILKDFMPYLVMEKNADLMIDRNYFDSLSGRMYNRRIVIRDGVRKDKPFFVRVYNPSEITALLGQVGLKIEQIFGDYNEETPVGQSRRMVVVARN